MKRECNEPRHMYEGDCCEHGSRCECHVHYPAKVFKDHTEHVFEWLQFRYEQAEQTLEPGTQDYERAFP